MENGLAPEVAAKEEKKIEQLDGTNCSKFRVVWNGQVLVVVKMGKDTTKTRK